MDTEIEKYEHWGKKFSDSERAIIMEFLQLAEKFKIAMLSGGQVDIQWNVEHSSPHSIFGPFYIPNYRFTEINYNIRLRLPPIFEGY